MEAACQNARQSVEVFVSGVSSTLPRSSVEPTTIALSKNYCVYATFHRAFCEALDSAVETLHEEYKPFAKDRLSEPSHITVMYGPELAPFETEIKTADLIPRVLGGFGAAEAQGTAATTR